MSLKQNEDYEETKKEFMDEKGKQLQITISNLGKEFSLAINGHYFRKRKDATLLFHQAEKRIRKISPLRTSGNTAIDLKVKEGTTLANWGTYDNPIESLYVLSCFLENHIPRDTKDRIYKEFHGRK